MTTYGSLCTGIGGLDLAVQAYCAAMPWWHSEIEPAPCDVLDRHFPGVPNLGDLKQVNWSEVPPVDMLTAGYPCQPFSHAGKRQGAEDERHLWPYIAEAVRVLRPRWVVLENVAGHLTLGFGDVLRDLAEAGFDAEWCVLRASDVGAPHQRARLFIVASDTEHGDDRRVHQGRAEADRAVERRSSPGAPGERAQAADRPAPDSGGERHGGGQDGRTLGRVDGRDAGEAWQRQRSRPELGDRSSAAVPDAHGIDDDRRWHAGTRRGTEPTDGDPTAADPHGIRGAAERSLHGGELDAEGRSAADATCERRGGREEPRANMECDGLQPALVGAGAGPRHPDPTQWGQYEPAIRRWEQGRLSPAFVEWMMGYPEGWVDGLTRTQALKALGNAVVPQQGLAALRELASSIESEAA